MKKVAKLLVGLIFIAALVICQNALAQGCGGGSGKSAEGPGSSEATEADEPLIPYSAPYDSPDTGADRADVDEDAE